MLLIAVDSEEFVHDSSRVNSALKTGLLVLPETAEGLLKKVSPKATVLRVGDACKYEFKTGDRILVGRFSFTRISHEQKNIHLISEEDILGYLDEGFWEVKVRKVNARS